MPTTVPIDSDSWLAIESPQFAVRFGRLLTATRRRSRRSIEDLARSSLGGFGVSQLRQFELGSATIDESTVEKLCLVYSADIGRILPVRLSVEVVGERISVAGVSVKFSSGDPTSVLTAYLRLIRRIRNQKKAPAIALRREDILTLARYLDIDGAEVVERLSTLMNVTAVQRHTMAMLFATGAIVIGLAAGGYTSADALTNPTDTANRSGESELVSTESRPDQSTDSVLVVTTDAVTVELAAPVTEPVTEPATASNIPDIVDMLPTTAPTAPVAAPIAEPANPIAEPATTNTEPAPALALAPNVEPELLATALTASAVVAAAPVAAAPVATAPVAGIDRGAAVGGLSTATRMQVPVATPPLTVAAEGPTSNRSGCNPDPSQAVMNLVIADISYSCPVYAGGQPMIDAGFVTLITDANPVVASRPGEPGTLWLAGHRTTHGAAFAHVPDLADGALVTVSSGDATATYRVVGRKYVEVRGGRVVDASGQPTLEATWASIIRDDFSGNLAPRLVLQTCEGEDFRWMVYADLVTG